MRCVVKLGLLSVLLNKRVAKFVHVARQRARECRIHSEPSRASSGENVARGAGGVFEGVGGEI